MYIHNCKYIRMYIARYMCIDMHTYVQSTMHPTIVQVTVSKDSSSNDYSLDAGALVLADQGTYVHAYVHACIHITYVCSYKRIYVAMYIRFM